MSGPRVKFHGKTETISALGLRSGKNSGPMVPPEPDGDGTIFVSIASYRGKRLTTRLKLANEFPCM